LSTRNRIMKKRRRALWYPWTRKFTARGKEKRGGRKKRGTESPGQPKPCKTVHGKSKKKVFNAFKYVGGKKGGQGGAKDSG